MQNIIEVVSEAAIVETENKNSGNGGMVNFR
jgi:hypothetical protein